MLASGSTYTLTGRGDTTNFYGFNGLPVITSTITIQGNGAIIERSSGAPSFRLFAIARQDPTTGAPLTTPGNLTLQDVVVRGGLAQGGRGGDSGGDDGGGGGGGAGLGGAIYNQGTLSVVRSTLLSNTAQGGAGGNGSTDPGAGDDGGGGGGGGLGGAGGNDSDDVGGGGGGFGGAGAEGSIYDDGGGGGGTVSDGDSSGTGGTANGGTGGNDSAGGPGGFGGGGGGGSDESAGGAGGLGGGGGSTGEDDETYNTGGAGGFGGGGGAGGEDNAGGAGGFGAGGGGASRDGAGTPATGGAGGFGAGAGGAITTEDDNTGGGGGAGLGGAIFNDGGTLVVENSTLSGNSASGGQGGIGQLATSNGDAGQGLGGGVFARNGSVTVDSSTLNANSAANGGSLYLLGDDETVYLDGAQTQVRAGDTTSVDMNVVNSILANTPGGGTDAFVNTVNGGTTSASANNNLVETNGTGANALAGVTVTADPQLGPLQDNGGLTPTFAINGTSPACNTGSTALTTDQRSFTRPSGQVDDIGAFEFIGPIPEVLSVLPQNTTDAVGANRTFSLTVRDGDGTSDIREMWLLVNTTLDWSGGATLVYFPQSGELYLRRGDDFGSPIKIGGAAGASDVLDNGALRIVGSQVSINTSQGGTSLTLTVPATVRNGLVGNNTLFGRVQDFADQVDPASPAGDFGFVPFGPYTVKPQFQGSANSVPTLSALSPKSAYTIIPSSGVKLQTFVFYAKDEDGIGDLDSLWFSAGKVHDGPNNATFIFLPRTRRLYLRSDDGSSFIGGGQIGTQGTIENSQVKVDLSQVQYLIYNDGKTVGLRLPLQPKLGLLGQNNIWLRVQDNEGATSIGGDDLGFVQSGTWNVTQQSGTLNGPAPSAPGS